MKRIITLLTSLLILTACSGHPTIKCKGHSNLDTKTFNAQNFKQCPTLETNAQPFPTASCVSTLINKEKVCGQYEQLVHDLNLAPNQIFSVQTNHAFLLTTIHYIADGQMSYDIISPNSCIIDTRIDPRTIDEKLSKQYANESFLILNTGKPTTSYDATQSMETVSIPLQIRKGCLACKIIGTANVKLWFDTSGKVGQAKVMQFEQDAG